jgi:hypothetical protein
MDGESREPVTEDGGDSTESPSVNPARPFAVFNPTIPIRHSQIAIGAARAPRPSSGQEGTTDER